MQKISNPFQVIALSPWPIFISVSLLRISFIVISSLCINRVSIYFILTVATILFFFTFLWWRDLKREASLQGHHTNYIIKLLKFRIIIFITSEVIFFISFFWAFFNRRISPNIEIGNIWPPIGIEIFQPIEIPLLNSIILLSSGATITWSHHSFLEGDINKSFVALAITISLGILFSFCQGIEYYESKFSFSDSIYGSTFFITTGFHGIHVLVGSIFLTISLIRIKNIENSKNHFICFDLRAWYWHFVDIVWLFLFISIYWWGS